MNAEQQALALSDLSKQVIQLRIQAATERLQAVGEIREARKDIARVKTIQREAELKIERAAAEKAETEGLVAAQAEWRAAVASRKALILKNEEGRKKAKEKAKAKAEKPAAKAKSAKTEKGAKAGSGAKADKAGSNAKGKGK